MNTFLSHDEYSYIRENHQVDKYNALNTYNVRLLTTQAENYTHATGNASTSPQTSGNQNNNLYWNLPAIPGNHINKCLIKLNQVVMPKSVYSFPVFSLVNGGGNHMLNYNSGSPLSPVLYVECDNVISKSFVSGPREQEGDGSFADDSHASVFRKSILGTYNVSDNYAQHLIGESAVKNVGTQNSYVIDYKSMTTSPPMLATNPFGGKINLQLISPTDFSAPKIHASEDGESGATMGDGATANLILDAPIIYDLTITLLPDNQANDRFTR